MDNTEFDRKLKKYRQYVKLYPNDERYLNKLRFYENGDNKDFQQNLYKYNKYKERLSVEPKNKVYKKKIDEYKHLMRDYDLGENELSEMGENLFREIFELSENGDEGFNMNTSVLSSNAEKVFDQSSSMSGGKSSDDNRDDNEGDEDDEDDSDDDSYTYSDMSEDDGFANGNTVMPPMFTQAYMYNMMNQLPLNFGTSGNTKSDAGVTAKREAHETLYDILSLVLSYLVSNNLMVSIDNLQLGGSVGQFGGASVIPYGVMKGHVDTQLAKLKEQGLVSDQYINELTNVVVALGNLTNGTLETRVIQQFFAVVKKSAENIGDVPPLDPSKGEERRVVGENLGEQIKAIREEQKPNFEELFKSIKEGYYEGDINKFDFTKLNRNFRFVEFDDKYLGSVNVGSLNNITDKTAYSGMTLAKWNEFFALRKETLPDVVKTSLFYAMKGGKLDNIANVGVDFFANIGPALNTAVDGTQVAVLEGATGGADTCRLVTLHRENYTNLSSQQLDAVGQLGFINVDTAVMNDIMDGRRDKLEIDNEYLLNRLINGIWTENNSTNVGRLAKLPDALFRQLGTQFDNPDGGGSVTEGTSSLQAIHEENGIHLTTEQLKLMSNNEAVYGLTVAKLKNLFISDAGEVRTGRIGPLLGDTNLDDNHALYNVMHRGIRDGDFSGAAGDEEKVMHRMPLTVFKKLGMGIPANNYPTGTLQSIARTAGVNSGLNNLIERHQNAVHITAEQLEAVPHDGANHGFTGLTVAKTRLLFHEDRSMQMHDLDERYNRWLVAHILKPDVANLTRIKSLPSSVFRALGTNLNVGVGDILNNGSTDIGAGDSRLINIRNHASKGGVTYDQLNQVPAAGFADFDDNEMPRFFGNNRMISNNGDNTIYMPTGVMSAAFSNAISTVVNAHNVNANFINLPIPFFHKLDKSTDIRTAWNEINNDNQIALNDGTGNADDGVNAGYITLNRQFKNDKFYSIFNGLIINDDPFKYITSTYFDTNGLKTRLRNDINTIIRGIKASRTGNTNAKLTSYNAFSYPNGGGDDTINCVNDARVIFLEKMLVNIKKHDGNNFDTDNDDEKLLFEQYVKLKLLSVSVGNINSPDYDIARNDNEDKRNISYLIFNSCCFTDVLKVLNESVTHLCNNNVLIPSVKTFLIHTVVKAYAKRTHDEMNTIQNNHFAKSWFLIEYIRSAMKTHPKFKHTTIALTTGVNGELTAPVAINDINNTAGHNNNYQEAVNHFQENIVPDDAAVDRYFAP